MFTTADLPADMRYDHAAAAAVAASGLTITCRHGDPHCPTCILAATTALTRRAT